ncbi:YolD-like family protein [Rossellomorea vietnamensis]|uniref:YolD-like family protein n=1 Tax=Rossellomorea aquimaris TaxID=189382 RepID=A0A5D4TQL4_9BACI|nr:YolD-like family protein [Rossellomorea aquimaris]TYS76356.1 YolD-like family protein [Rossellomorea aquimaris]
MNRDRGRIKWTSMMLPEHVKLLRDWAHEDSFEQQKKVDEQHLEELNEIAAEAMEFSRLVTITHYAGRRHELLIGRIHYYDGLKGKLHVLDRFEKKYYLSINDIADIHFTEE